MLESDRQPASIASAEASPTAPGAVDSGAVVSDGVTAVGADGVGDIRAGVGAFGVGDWDGAWVGARGTRSGIGRHITPTTIRIPPTSTRIRRCSQHFEPHDFNQIADRAASPSRPSGWDFLQSSTLSIRRVLPTNAATATSVPGETFSTGSSVPGSTISK